MIRKTALPMLLLSCAATVLLATAESPGQGRKSFADARDRMVDREIVDAGVKNARVVRAMRTVPRHEFVPIASRKQAYFDMALPIGHRQTISPQFVVAFMTEQLDPRPTDKVLEIGTGSGYQAAVLSGLVGEVYTIEIVEPLGRRAARDLRRLGYRNVHVKVGDGFQGWPQHAPFDKIIVTCSPESVPPALAGQLKEGGLMVIPVGQRYQQTLYMMRKTGGRMRAEALLPTLFVPMTGRAEENRRLKPDPDKPSIVNGDFEEVEEDSGRPVGWHYQRQLELVSALDAPSGKSYATFSNAQRGRGSQALQGFAVDGRKVKQIEISLHVRGKNIRSGLSAGQLPVAAVTFFDSNRTPVGEEMLGPWRGSFSWQTESGRIAVPPRAREAVLRIGLLGAAGEISFDAVKLNAVKK